MNGLLLIDKPIGWTSFDVVAKVRGILSQSKVQSQKVERDATFDVKTLRHLTSSQKIKVGHTGTLDPLATGLMIVVVGDYCKRAQEFSKLDKVYEVTMKLGQTSTTADDEGEKTDVSGLQPPLSEVEKVLGSFVGDSLQVPPAFSAIKVNGQRAYNLARKGQAVKLEARPVHIESISMQSYNYPVVNFRADVSSGTYIRSLVTDIGEKLQTGAYMSALERTSVGRWSLPEALQIDNLKPETLQSALEEVAI